MKPQLELVTTGSELLNGSVLNGHAQWLGIHLFDTGWELVRDTTVSDELTAIYDALTSALSRVDVVIVSGGLGPTGDDRTRDAAAKWMGAEVVMHEPTKLRVMRAFQKRNKPLNATAGRHALIVDGATVLENHHGLAAGEYLQKNGKHLFLLPGPPAEFQGVLRDHVVLLLQKLRNEKPALHHIFQTAGLGESDIAARLEKAGISDQLINISYCAKPGNVSVRLKLQEGLPEDFGKTVQTVREQLGPCVYAERDVSIEDVLGKLLIDTKQTLAVAESCTGGMIGARITSVSGSSKYMRGGVIAYTNDVKQKLLHVDAELLYAHGAVSSQVAEAMAAGVRNEMDSDIGLSVTGIAGPAGGTPEKPVGLVYIGISDAAGTVSRAFHLGGGRDTIRNATSVMAMDLVRRRLLHTDG